MKVTFSVPMAGGELPAAILYLPEGDNYITPTVNGEGKRILVRVDRSCLPCLQRDLTSKLAQNVRPVSFFDHKNGAASHIPTRFEYVDGIGVLLHGEWTGKGGDGILNRDYGYYSPVFRLSLATNKPIGLSDGVEIGSLTNDPAFENIARISASKAEEQGPVSDDDNDDDDDDNDDATETGKQYPNKAYEQNQNRTMLEELIKAGILTQEESKSDNVAKILADKFAELKSQKADVDKAKMTEEELKAKDKEISELKCAKSNADDLEAQVKAAKAELESIKKDKEGLIDAEIECAVSAGKISDKDEDAKHALRSALTADLKCGKTLIASMQPNPAFVTVVAGKSAVKEELSGRDRQIKSQEK